MKKGRGGLTLFELLVVLFILVLLAAMAAPALVHLSARLAADTAIRQAMQVALLSRQRAALTQQAIVWCADDGHMRCAGDWRERQYWLVFADQGRNGRFDAEDRLVSRIHAGREAGWFVWKGFAKGNYLMWLPSGYGSYQNGTLTYCPARANPALVRQLVLSRTGRPRYQVLDTRQRQTVWSELCLRAV